jgi:hypothetical protein
MVWILNRQQPSLRIGVPGVATHQQATAKADRVEALFARGIQGCGGGFALRQIRVLV